MTNYKIIDLKNNTKSKIIIFNIKRTRVKYRPLFIFSIS